ncbi:MAG TPA: ankyrin repeat domain-containing protein [Verrucomicrobiae bacterium]|nr:ankyrin repeat domain-containing protein [Verrucomicrobiae bacterium]
MKALLVALFCASICTIGCDRGKAKARLQAQAVAVNDESLFKYARSGDVEKVSLLLRAGCSPNAEEKYSGRTPLICAAENDHLDLVKYLLSSRANVNQAVKPKIYREGLPLPGWSSRTEHPYPGWTALMFATERGHTEIVRTLLAAGADPNINGAANLSKADNNTTALILAARKGNMDCVEMLLKAGANVNASDLLGNTPLLVAANADIMQRLIKAGADVHVKGRHGDTLLRRAVGRVDERMIRVALAAGADLNARDERGRTVMFAARGRAIKLLVDLGADINVKDNQGITPVMEVARDSRYFANVMTFFKAGANLQGLSPWEAFLFLQDAVNANDFAAVKAALDAGANVNETRGRGGHILQTARRAGNQEIIQALLQHGADPALLESH